MKRAHTLPIGCVALEILRRHFIARGAHRAQAFGVAHEDRVSGIKHAEQRFGEMALGRGRARQAIKNPSAFRRALNEAGLRQ
jgi:hypothetical protein